ncbi:hypothetical protein [Pseudomonas sp. DC3000-4b1]|uniref:hypothetical protein n=1 Tax=unclassified Pseudomonas TaxID=196821 RepID=UPI003CE7B63E
MYRKLLLIASLGTLLGACAPYATSGYVQTDVYTVQSPTYEYRPYAYPYGYTNGYYVRPAPRYYVPAPHYYRLPPPPPPPAWRPGPPPRPGMGWHGGPPPHWRGDRGPDWRDHGRGGPERGYWQRDR